MSSKAKLMEISHASDAMFLTIQGNSQGLISEGASTPESIGNMYKSGHENEIFVKGFHYGGSNPTHQGSGSPLGQGASHPLIVNKLVDKSSPLLYNALKGELFPHVELKCYRTSYFGRPEHFYTIVLTDARLVNMTAYSQLGTNTPMEDMYLSYKKITFKHETAHTISQNNWCHSFIPVNNLRYDRSKVKRVGDLLILGDGFIVNTRHEYYYRSGLYTPIPRHVTQEFALSGLSVVAAIAGGFLTGGASWVAWGTGFALDARSVYLNDMDYTYGASSIVGFPFTGTKGAILGTGISAYNGFWR